MRIAVISDTHDEFPPDLPSKLKGADEIWHLGDVTDPDVLTEFALLGVPVVVVRGNCDSNEAWPLEKTLIREGVVCHLVHIPPQKAPGGAHALLHGHTHVPRNEVDAVGVRWLNPGSVSKPRGDSSAGFAWLEVAKGRIVGWAREVC